MKYWIKRATLLVVALAVIAAPHAQAAINPEINYQGKLTTSTNIAVTNATYNMEFKLYTVPVGGSPVWTETWCVGTACSGSGTDNRIPVTSGLFSTLLGSTTPFDGVDFNQPLYLGINIGGSGSTPSWDGEMTPRKLIGAVPAAFVAQKLNGLESTQFLRSDAANSTSTASTYLTVQQNGAGDIANFNGPSSVRVLTIKSGGNVGIGTSSPAYALTVNGDGFFTGNLTSANINATGTLAVLGSTTLQNFTGVNATTTSATSTNIFSTFARFNDLILGTLNGPLQANNGVVSATTSVGVLYGGTGLASAPAYGQVLLGNAAGGYDLTGTTSLGLGTGFFAQNGNSFGATGVLGTNDAFNLNFITGGTTRGTFDTNGNFGIGTTTPSWPLSSFSASVPQLALSAGAGLAQWTMRNAGGNLYVSPTNTAGTATSTTTTVPLLLQSNGNVAIGTSSPASATFTLAGSGVFYAGSTFTAFNSSYYFWGSPNASSRPNIFTVGSNVGPLFAVSTFGHVAMGTSTMNPSTNMIFPNGWNNNTGSRLFEIIPSDNTHDTGISLQTNDLGSNSASRFNMWLDSSTDEAYIDAQGFYTPSIQFRTGNDSTMINAMIIQNNGPSPAKIGIGTTNPGSFLSVTAGVAIGTTYATLGAPTSGLLVQGKTAMGTTSALAMLDVANSNNATTPAFQVSTVASFATTTNLKVDSTGLTTISNLVVTGSSTLQNFTGLNSTTTNATTTSLFTSNANLSNAIIGSLNGPLQANNGVVSATTSVGVLYGGTGLTTAPGYGNLLVGNATNGYTLMSTSSLNIAVSDTVGILPVLRGGTGASSFGQGWLYSDGGTGALNASTSPTINYFTATSTTATSTINTGGFAVGGTGLVVQQNSNFVGIGTTSPNQLLTVAGHGVFGTQTSTSSSNSAGLNTLSINELTTDTVNSIYNIQSQLEVNTQAASSRLYYAGYFNSNTGTGNGQNFTGRLVALQGQADHNGTGIITEARGIAGSIANWSSGTITNAYAGRFSISNNDVGTIANAYGVYVVNGANTGTIVNKYGLYIENQSNASTLNYSIYSAGGTNYLAGNTGIGTTTPGQKLSVAGDVLGNNFIGSFFTATSTTASVFPYASTTALTIAGVNGLTLAALNGPLQANNGVVSATTSVGVLYGGTGATSFGQGWIYSDGGIGALNASTSPTINYFTATSTSATSTISSGGFAVAGTGLVVQSSSGNVGIGTSSPLWPLSVSSAAGPQLSLSDGAANAQWTFRNAGGNLYLGPTNTAGTATSTSTTVPLALFSNGNVGIGTSTVSSVTKFTLSGAGIFYAGSNINGAGSGFHFEADGSGNGRRIISAAAGAQGLFAVSTFGHMALGTSSVNTSTMTFPIGWNTNSGGRLFEIISGGASTDAGISLQSPYEGDYPPNSFNTWLDNSTDTGYIDANGYNTTDIQFRVGNDTTISTIMTLKNLGTSGRLGVGTTNPGSFLSVSAGTAIGSAYATLAAPTSGLIIQGITGIGTSSPSARLDVISTNNATNAAFQVSTVTSNATTTNLLVDSTGLTTLTNLLVSGSSTLQNFTGGNSTSTNATSTSIFATIANFTGLTLGSLNGPLQANNGLVSATTSVGVLYGGTGLTTAPIYGNILVGNAVSGYTLTSTSSLNIALSDTTGVLAVARGGTGASSFGQGWLYTDGGTGALNASTSPTINYFTATSTSATSTIAGAFAVGGTGLVVQQNSKFVGIGTSTPGMALNIAGSQYTSGSIYTSGNIFAAAATLTGTLVGQSAIFTNGGSVYFAGDGGRSLEVHGNGTSAYFDMASTLATDYDYRALVSTAGTFVLTASTTSNQLVLTNIGTVGIGAAAPTVPLEIATTTGSINLMLTNTLASGYSQMKFNGTGEDFQIGVGNASETFWGVPNKFFIFDGTANAMRAVIDSTGNLGLGTTSPFAKLSVHANNSETNRFLFAIASSTASATTTLFNVMNTGNVGLGSTTPWGLLSINPNALGSGVPEFVIGSSTATHLLVDGAGNVGISSTTPTSTLSVVGTGYFSGLLRAVSVFPTIDNTGTIGNSASRFLSITIGDGGFITTGVSSATGNLNINSFSGNTTVNSIGARIINNATNNTTDGTSKYGTYISSTGSFLGAGGGTTNNYGLYVDTTSGAANNYSAIFAGGNVGIGTASPQTLLDVSSSLGATIRLSSTKNDAAWTLDSIMGGLDFYGADTSGGTAAGVKSYIRELSGNTTFGGSSALSFGVTPQQNTSAIEALRINEGGFIGIASTTPWGLLSVNPNALGSGVPEFVIGSSTATHLIVTGNGNLQVGSTTSTTGRVIIRPLAASSDGLFVRESDDGFDAVSLIGNAGQGVVNLFSAGVNTASFAGSSGTNSFINAGNFGVGTSSPLARLDVAGTNNGTVPLFQVSSVASFATTTQLIVTNAGYVGIGSTTPYGRLSVTSANSTGITPAMIVANSANTPRMFLADNGQVSFGGTPSASTGYADFTGTLNNSSTAFVNMNGVFISDVTSQMAGLNFQQQFRPSGATLGAIYGILALPTLSNSATPITTVYSTANRIDLNSSYTATVVTGAGVNVDTPTITVNPITNYSHFKGTVVTNGNATTTGTINNFGLQLAGMTAAAASGGTVNNFGVSILMPAASGAGTNNNRALSITGSPSTGGGGTTNNYAIYNSSSADNYIAGNVGIGSTSPSKLLSVGGESGFTGKMFLQVDDTQTAPVQLMIKGNTNINQQLLIGYNTTNDYGSIQAIKQGTAFEPLILNGGGGNIGIGTTTPSEKLDADGGNQKGKVKFNLSTADSIIKLYRWSGTGGTYHPWYLATGRGANGADFSIQGTTAAAIPGAETMTDYLFIKQNTGLVGIGTSTASSKLAVQGNMSIGVDYANSAATNGLNVEGNVGIGTQSPTGQLSLGNDPVGTVGSLITGYGRQMSINGDFNTSYNSGNEVKLLINGFSNDVGDDIYPMYVEDENNQVNFFLRSKGNAISNDTPARTMYLNGNFGIGSTTPLAKLSISANNGETVTNIFMIASSTASATTTVFNVLNTGLIGVGSTTPWGLLSVNPNALGSSVPEFVIGSSTTTHLIVNGGGFVGIGTTTPDVGLNVNLAGTHNGIGGVTALFSSATIVGPQIYMGGVGGGTYDGHDWSLLAGGSGNNTAFVSTGSLALVDRTSAVTRLLVNSSGNIGIGTTSPSVMLHIGSAAAGGSVRIANGYLCVDTNDTCSAANAAGGIYSVSAATTGADLAENYKTNDPTLAAGQIVALDTTTAGYIRRAQGTDEVFGVVSTQPGVLLGRQITQSRAVALTGRVPLMVNNEGGVILTGDRIALSSVAGVGKKAYGSEASVGVALEEFNGTTGTIEVFMDKHANTFKDSKLTALTVSAVNSIQSSITVADNGNVGIGTTTPNYKLQVAGDVAATAFVNVSTRGSKKDIQYVSEADKDAFLTKLRSLKVATYHYNMEADNAPMRLGLIAEEAPSEVLSVDGKGVDLYKLTTFMLATSQVQDGRVTKLETDLATLASTTAASLPGTQGFTAAVVNAVSSYLGDLGIKISSSLAEFKDVIAEKLTAKSVKVEEGITVKDKTTGMYYCIVVNQGTLTNVAGECGSGTTSAPTTVAPTPTPSPTVTSTVTPSTSTSTPVVTGTSTPSESPVVTPTTTVVPTPTTSPVTTPVVSPEASPVVSPVPSTDPAPVTGTVVVDTPPTGAGSGDTSTTQ